MRLAAAVAIAAGVFAAGLWLGNRRLRPDDRTLTRLDVELRADGSLGSEVGTDVVISRDGTRLAYVFLGRDGVARLNTLRLRDSAPDSAAPELMAREVRFSRPTGGWIGFFAAGKMKKVPVEGGSPVVLCDATDLLGASWGEDGEHHRHVELQGHTLARPGRPAVLHGKSANCRRTGRLPRWPQILPGGTHVLYTAIRGFEADRGNIEVMSLRDGTRKVLARGGTFGRYLDPGFLSYVNQGTLYVAPFDPEPPGDARTGGSRVGRHFVLAHVRVRADRHLATLERSSTGNRRGAGESSPCGSTAPGRPNRSSTAPGRYTTPRLSPDGRRFAMSVVDGGIQGLAFYEQKGGRATRSPIS